MSNSYSKLAALAILALMLASIWFIAGEPYVALWQDRFAKAERLQRKQVALLRLIQDRESYQQQFQAITGSRGLQEAFLDDKFGALADAKLQRIVKQAATDNGAKLLQAVIFKARSKRTASAKTGNDKAVTVKVQVQGSIESIYTMLQALENSRPLIVISNLQVTHQKSRYPVSQLASATSYRASYDATSYIL